MKKSLLALAVLGAYAGVASAQSSVTLYGTLDVGGRYVKADGQDRRLTEETDGINSSQLGLRGVEDLGGGLKAGFTLLSGINVNSGSSNSKFWNRRSTVSLFGNWGELRLGRDYRPDFWNLTIFDAFGTNGIGSSLNVRPGVYAVNQGQAGTYGGTRSDNSIGYFLPSNIGGFYGQLMVASANGISGGAGAAPTADRFGRLFSGRFGFAAGPFDVAAAFADQRRNDLAAAGNTPSQKTWNIGGAWDFGVAKIMGYYDHEALDASAAFNNIEFKEDNWSISGVIPFGQSEVHLGYDWDKLKPSKTFGSQTVTQLKATYQYNVSKRTAMYGTASWLKNNDQTRATLPGAAGPATSGGKSQGFEVGLRHFF